MVTDDDAASGRDARTSGGTPQGATHSARIGLWRAVALVAAITVLALGTPLVVGRPSAWACSCPAATSQLTEPMPDDVVFEGRVLEGDRLVGGETVWTVQVARVLRGDATTVQPVVSQSNSASCGLSLRIGETYLVDATIDRDRPGVLRTGLCSATAPVSELTAAQRREHEVLLGPGHPPTSGEPARAAPTTAHGAVALVAAAAVGVVALACVALAIRRRRAR